MRVQLKKGKDSRPTLACVRPDGTRTWGTVHPFFPIHDLTHYAVESVFAFDRAFYGLIASGWSIELFEDPVAREGIPVQAMWAESLVGLFDLERGMSRRLSAEEFNDALAASLSGQGLPAFRPVTEDELGRVRALRGDLSAQWSALSAGETLDVPFPAVTAGSARNAEA